MHESDQENVLLLMRQAFEAQELGRLHEAQQHYQHVLQIDPYHAEANFNIGLLAVQANEAVRGLPYLLRALEAAPQRGQYWLGYIEALFHADQLDAAKEVLALARQQGLQGDDVDALAMRLEVGAVHPPFIRTPGPKLRQTGGGQPAAQDIAALTSLFNEGKLAEAIALAQLMTAHFPRHPFGWKVLGLAFKQAGRDEDALPAMQRTAALLPNDAQAHGNLGVILKDMGRLEEAEASLRRALKLKHDYAQAHCNLGATLKELKRPEEAAKSLRRALQLSPDYADAHNNLGLVLEVLGLLQDAQTSYLRALEIKPNLFQVYSNLGNVQRALGMLTEAEASYRHSLEFCPDYVEALCNLGVTLQDMSRFTEAESCYRQALSIRPDYVQAYSNLGVVLQSLGRLDESVACLIQAVQFYPDYADAHNNLGYTLHVMGRFEEAADCYLCALRIEPEFAQAYCNLGFTRLMQSRLDEAHAALDCALKINDFLADAHCNMGITLMEMGRMAEAEASCQHAIQLKPDFAVAHSNLGIITMGLGRLEEAAACFNRALQLRPDFADAHSNLIFALDMTESSDIAALQAVRHRWNCAHAAHLHQHRVHLNCRNPERRLRIGYISADFRGHSAAYAFGAMLVHFDEKLFDVIAYSNSVKQDAMTDVFREGVTVWRTIFGLSDDAVAELVREDEIDILVDLSGHSAGNRLLVFARKPAPIQITAWGYATGTGMGAMDVLFSDPVFVPQAEIELYVEQVRYLPCSLGTYFSNDSLVINELPALSAKGITFGSFNRLVKNSDATYEAWARILLALPDSRMIIKTEALDDLNTRERVSGYFVRAGIEADRILLQGKTTRDQHLAAFNQIDIALDPFPHGGGVTAMEGLMMGVPVVTLRWPTIAGRISASIMTQLGLTDWIAESVPQYVELAIQKATEVPSLAALRSALPGIWANSVIGDQARYVGCVEREYRLLWREWCASDSC